ncbi:MAG: PepSY domain-containing protein [Alphaproteobacteria bacterium]|nr:PepSY domain-containing protein [Alphaproteobacteria bacterium]
MILLQWLRSIHGWLGLFVMPWIVLIGFTGFYLNHPQPVLAWLDRGDIDDGAFPTAPAGTAVDEAYALAIAGKLLPQVSLGAVNRELYHGHPALFVRAAGHEVIVQIASGYYFDKTDYSRAAYDRDGNRLHTKIYWGRVLKEFHVRGWLGGRLGTYLADATSLAMIVFGLSGIYLFLWPRWRRFRLRRAR